MGARLLNIATWIGASIGTAFLTVALFCVAFGYSIILFSTGSMAPTVPQGSLSVVKSVPASHVEVGDILTVARAGQAPITHRVVEIKAGRTSDERVVIMQGDANARPDADSYTITEGQVQIFSIPGVAYPFQAVFGKPWLTVTVFVLVGSLVTAAFWPTKRRSHRLVAEKPDRSDDTYQGIEALLDDDTLLNDHTHPNDDTRPHGDAHPSDGAKQGIAAPALAE